MKLLAPTLGLSMRERFDSDDLAISSVSYSCRHGSVWEVEVRCKRCGRVRVVAHSHSYREHWGRLYDASERLIVRRSS